MTVPELEPTMQLLVVLCSFGFSETNFLRLHFSVTFYIFEALNNLVAANETSRNPTQCQQDATQGWRSPRTPRHAWALHHFSAAFLGDRGSAPPEQGTCVCAPPARDLGIPPSLQLAPNQAQSFGAQSRSPLHPEVGSGPHRRLWGLRSRCPLPQTIPLILGGPAESPPSPVSLPRDRVGGTTVARAAT